MSRRQRYVKHMIRKGENLRKKMSGPPINPHEGGRSILRGERRITCRVILRRRLIWDLHEPDTYMLQKEKLGRGIWEMEETTPYSIETGGTFSSLFEINCQLHLLLPPPLIGATIICGVITTKSTAILWHNAAN